MRKLVIFTLFLFVASSAFADEPKSLWSRDWLAESQRKVSSNSESEYSPEVADAYRHIDMILPDVTALSEDEFSFEVEGVKHFAKVHHIERRSAENMTWVGYVDGGQFLSVFHRNGKLLASHLVVSAFGGVKYYKISPKFGKHDLEEVNISKIMDRFGDDRISVDRLGVSAYGLAVAQNTKRRSIGVSYLDCPRGQTPFYTIDLMVIHDTTALSRFGSEAELVTYVQSLVDMLNATLINSEVFIGKFNLIGVVFVNYTASGSSWNDMVWAVNDSGVNALGESKKADITSFMIGRANDGGGWGGGPWNIWVIDFYWYIFVHENGHSIGLSHQPEDQPVGPNEEYPFARAHFVPGLFKTAVATSFRGCGADCPAIPVYSNPKVLFEGVPTGVPNERNNALMANIQIPKNSKNREGSPVLCSVPSFSGKLVAEQNNN